MKELSALGLQDALAAVACQPQDYAFFTRHGQLVYREPWGLAAGHQWPHFSIHRADLHQVLLDAVRERLGPQDFITGHRCVGIEQSDDGASRRASSPPTAPRCRRSRATCWSPATASIRWCGRSSTRTKARSRIAASICGAA